MYALSMNQLDYLLQIEDILTKTTDGGRENGPPEDYMIAGAMVIGFYTSPEGDAAGTWVRVLGGMDAFRQVGVLQDQLRIV